MMKVKEIAKELDCSQQNVYNLINRGIKKLYKNIKKIYNIDNEEALEMLVVGLNIDEEKVIKSIVKNLK